MTDIPVDPPLIFDFLTIGGRGVREREKRREPRDNEWGEGMHGGLEARDERRKVGEMCKQGDARGASYLESGHQRPARMEPHSYCRVQHSLFLIQIEHKEPPIETQLD